MTYVEKTGTGRTGTEVPAAQYNVHSETLFYNTLSTVMIHIFISMDHAGTNNLNKEVQVM